MTVPFGAAVRRHGQSEAVALHPGEGAGFNIGQMRLTVKENGERTAEQVVIMEIAVPAGAASPPPHIHRRGGESWYVLEGELDVLAGGEQGRYGPGSFVMIPAGTPHRFANASTEPVRLLLTMTSYQLRFLEEASRIWTAGPPDPAALVELMARYDTELVRVG
ncbi:MAG: cupin domain-containing protein [Chloroflexi bacterium]|nr:cupin domain-containing protein [Chloroflexota bacterium]